MFTPDDRLGGLPVAGRPVTVFGAGGAALAAITQLRAAGADLTVVAPTAGPSVTDLARRGRVIWIERAYRPADLDRPWLVVAATGEPGTDKQIETDAESRRLWCLRPREPVAVPRQPIGPGRVTLVGGGPGDPELMTLAGLEVLRAADVVITDRLAPLSLLDEVPAHTEIVDSGKSPRGKAMSQDQINALLIEHARAGRHVVRVKGGDSFLFGRGGEEVVACTAAGVDVRVVPGVSSALAAPTAASIPVTHRGLAQGVTIVSGHVPPEDPRSTVDYAALAHSGTTLVFLMAMANLSAITTALIDAGLPAVTSAAVIADATSDQQQVVRGTVDRIAEDAAVGITPPAVVVIGTVAALDPTVHRE